jgi:hypothetical protein
MAFLAGGQENYRRTGGVNRRDFQCAYCADAYPVIRWLQDSRGSYGGYRAQPAAGSSDCVCPGDYRCRWFLAGRCSFGQEQGLNYLTVAQNQVMLEKTEVETVLKDKVSLTGCAIQVKVSRSKLTLTGNVSSSDQKGEAERIAWTAVGVWSVDNELVIK